jgi:branched-chain amino acid transport system permease protein
MIRIRLALIHYGLLALFVGMLALLPFIGLPTSWYIPLIFADFFAMFVMSWDLLAGYAGQVSFGQTFFIGTAAYTSGLLNIYLHWTPALTIPLGVGASVLVGALVGAPAIRLKGPYLALVTLVLPIAASRLIGVYADFTGGNLGKTIRDTVPNVARGTPYLQYLQINYYYALILMTLIALFLIVIAHSRWGKIFEAIRDNEEAVAAAGISPAKYKILAFILSASIAGLAGAAYVHLPVLPVLQAGGPDGVFSSTLSMMIIVASVVGGMGTITGGIVGAYLLKVGPHELSQWLGAQQLATDLQRWTMLIFLVTLVLLVLFARRGLVPLLLKTPILRRWLTLPIQAVARLQRQLIFAGSNDPEEGHG